ncbi:MAG: TetR/AcrR family transcriptional regulator [Ignavibacteriales bacterium]|nr:TetR/AcrR family transcriptional regulator [Ignavibacteriales bacterium]
MANDRKNQIIRAAAKRFARHGLNKTTLDEVARDIRIGKATIYHYFTSKDDLYFATLKWECENFIDQVKIILERDSDSLTQKLTDYFGQKEIVSENNKLIHEALLTFFIEKSFKQELDIINWMLTKESELIKQFLTKHYSQRIKKTSSTFPNFIVMNSWGMFFANKLNSLLDASKT